ncbi:hypothetical protein [Hahella ganghwensis]|uniref:hypothetical protein n=1 Tax=Hahella ganghwensis TaxID=286420 RepID=UPI000377BD28|nr:hypothetical protein [Hahella ganghwensis]
MSIELSPPSRLLSVLDAMSPSNTQSVSNTAENSVADLASPQDQSVAYDSGQPSSVDPASSLLTEDFGESDLSSYAQSELPVVDNNLAAAGQAQQWVQYILSAWS